MPRIGDHAAAERGFARWSRLPDPLADVAAGAVQVDVDRLLGAVFGNSSYLSEALLAEPGVLCSFLRDGPDVALEELLGQLRLEAGDRRAKVMAMLRLCKRRLALLTAQLERSRR